jgi:hypothetical protein
MLHKLQLHKALYINRPYFSIPMQTVLPPLVSLFIKYCCAATHDTVIRFCTFVSL